MVITVLVVRTTLGFVLTIILSKREGNLNICSAMNLNFLEGFEGIRRKVTNINK
ncbi:hypothetical protein KH172YL63_12580 [Bacillus sp. KH172YL63]|nr:hypothetical protein KH172YL63_12580 [Bacillus sp. KH172YL63]